MYVKISFFTESDLFGNNVYLTLFAFKGQDKVNFCPRNTSGLNYRRTTKTNIKGPVTLIRNRQEIIFFLNSRHIREGKSNWPKFLQLCTNAVRLLRMHFEVTSNLAPFVCLSS